MKNFKYLEFIFIPVLSVFSFCSKSAVFGPENNVLTGNFTINWTNSSTGCSGRYDAYRIYESINGKYVKTYSVTNSSQKSYSFTNKSAATYHYFVAYANCIASGSTYNDAGSIDVYVISGQNADRDVVFIHTDLLGTPASETNLEGEVN